MSGLGKVFLVIAIIGALACGVLGFLINGEKKEKASELDTTTATLQSTKSKLTETEGKLSTTETTLSDTTSKLTEANAKADSLQTNLTAAQAKVKDLEKSVEEAQTKVTAAQAELNNVTKALDGKSPEEFKAAAKKAEDDLAALQAEKRIIDDQLAAQKAEVARLTKYIADSKTGSMAPGISGKVTAVNKTWNFVVLNIGNQDGVVENGIFVVYRGGQLVGKVKVVSTEPHQAIADILPEWTKAPFQVGDEVLD